jgi:hypothetical protein
MPHSSDCRPLVSYDFVTRQRKDPKQKSHISKLLFLIGHERLLARV